MWQKKLFLVILLMLLTICFFLGCAVENPSVSVGTEEKITITDSIGRQVTIPHPVTKAVVSNAYNAELINAVGAIDSVIGVDYYIYQDQEGFAHRFTKDMVIGQNQGGLNYEKIIALKPQILILTENGSWQEAEEKLKPFGIEVITVNAYYTDEFEKNTKLLGKIFGKEKESEEFADYFLSKLTYIRKQLQGVPKRSVYFEYRSPGKTTVPGNYFYKMVEYSGGDNIYKEAKSVDVDIEDVIKKNPEYIIKVSDVDVYSSYHPPSLEEKKKIKQDIVNRPGWEHIKAVQDDKILLLSHYVHGGASKLVGTMYIAKYLYPEYLPELQPEQIFRDWLCKYQHLDYIAGHTYPRYKLAD